MHLTTAMIQEELELCCTGTVTRLKVGLNTGLKDQDTTQCYFYKLLSITGMEITNTFLFTLTTELIPKSKFVNSNEAWAS